MILHINVTRDDLDNGFRFKEDCCPIALAVKRALVKLNPDVALETVSVDGDIEFQFPYFKEWKLDARYCKPIEEFTYKYDREDFVSPFEMDLFFHEKEYNDD